MLPRTASWALHLQQEDEEVEELEEGMERFGEEKEKQAPVYQFSGKSAAQLPDSFLPPGSLAGDATFTLVFWFRYNNNNR